MLDAGVNILTGGNHIFKKKGYEEIFLNFENKIIRPANYPEGVAGKGFATIKVNDQRVVIINLCGRVFMDENLDDPFREYDDSEKLLDIAKSDIVVVDLHAEATSEKNAFGWYVDGRASVVIGTHTHVPTADIKILPRGTAYVSDAGMVGARDSVIGTEKEGPLKMFLTQLPAEFEQPESGVCQVNAVLIEINNESGKAEKIERVDTEVNI
jgi:metallophosphoesterase (TIGR00282 family)